MAADFKNSQTRENLMRAFTGESQARNRYTFAAGFPKVAASFHLIAGIEKTHGDRFARFAQMLEDNKLTISDVETGWMCLHCGYVHWGKEAPKECPVCQHDRGYFIRIELAPFQNF